MLSCSNARVRASAAAVLLAAAFLGSAVSTQDKTASRGEPPRPPNVIVILSDDQGYADAGVYGSRDIPTPAIDRLAAQGVRFTNGYANHPVCSPSRAGFLTGRYQHRFGYDTNPVFDPGDPGIGLPRDAVTLADAMKAAGYVTGLIGKWHLGAAPAQHPNSRGFDEFYGFLGGGHDYFPATSGFPDRTKSLPFIGFDAEWEVRSYSSPILRNREPAPVPGYLTEAFGAEAVSFIRRHRSEPFFLYLAFNAPHAPLQAPAKRIARFTSIADEKRRLWAAMISVMDDHIGAMLDTLADTGLDRDTLVVFMGDNGGQTLWGADNGPLRERKGTTYEGGLRVPFVARWPGTVPAGRVVDTPVIGMDVFPTALAASGRADARKYPLEGVDLLPIMKGTAPAPERALFWRLPDGDMYCVRQGPFKLVKPRQGSLELYDLGSDIGERTNLAPSQPDRVRALQDLFDAWNSRNATSPASEGGRAPRLSSDAERR